MPPCRSAFGVALVVAALSLFSAANAQQPLFPDSCISEPEALLFAQWEDSSAAPDLERALLLAEGVAEPVAQQQYLSILERLNREVAGRINPRDSHEKKSKTLFRFLHQKVLRKYLPASQLPSTLTNGDFNCLTATALYVLLARRLDIPTEVVITPTHVYALADPLGKRVVLELTDPRDGFDFRPDRRRFIRYLTDYKLISRAELQERGEEAIYRDYVEFSRIVPANALVADTFNNRFAAAYEAGDLDKALCRLRKAMLTDPESTRFPNIFKIVLGEQIDLAKEDYPRYAPHLLAGMYLFANDETFLAYAWDVWRYVLQNKIDAAQYGEGNRILEWLQANLENPDQQAELGEIERQFVLNHAITLLRRGEPAKAYRTIEPLFLKSPMEPAVRDSYVESGVQNMVRLANYGKVDSAMVLGDTLLARVSGYPVVRATCVQITLMQFNLNPDLRKDLEKAFAMISRAYQLDPENVYVRELLMHLYEDRAMEKVRQTRYREGRRIAREGLEIDPDNQRLKDTVSLIDRALGQGTLKKSNL